MELIKLLKYRLRVLIFMSLCFVVDSSILNVKPKISKDIILFHDSKITTEDESKYLDGADHPCYRACVAGESMTCHYDFTLEQYHTMSKACYDCPYNVTDCYRKDCVVADGVKRSITVVNRKLPGPKIEVCSGDTVIVDVHNAMLVESTTIHWHGLHMKDTPYMDGVPMVTQCPIHVGTTFRYKFTAQPQGTHLWHSHIGVQRTDGVAGAIVIREAKSIHQDLYDFDLSEHVIHIFDWLHDIGSSSFTSNNHAGGRARPMSLLINGKGRYQEFSYDRGLFIPFEKFTVTKGYRYRFRIINSSFMTCPVEMSVAGHNITLISSDGSDVRPVTAASLVLYNGERFDIILESNQDIDNYWFMFRGLLNCKNLVSTVAWLHYENAPDHEPENIPTWDESHREGLQVNAVNIGTGQLNTLAIPELITDLPDDESLKEIPDVKHYIAYDFYTKDNTSFHKYPYYGINQVSSSLRTLSPQLNHISMKMPKIVLLSDRDRLDPMKHFCNESTVHNCTNEYCHCSHVISIPLNAVVELIIVDEGLPFDSNHPIHLHGYKFRVIGMEKVGKSTNIEEIKRLDEEGKLQRNLNGAPLKDDITIPEGGYTIIRFKADNPGYWIIHCHIDFHAEIGMALVFKVGEHKDMLPVPEHFPTCGDYMGD